MVSSQTPASVRLRHGHIAVFYLPLSESPMKNLEGVLPVFRAFVNHGFASTYTKPPYGWFDSIQWVI